MGQAVGLLAIGAALELLEHKGGIPGAAAVGLGHVAVAAQVGMVKLMDSPDKRDPVAIALEGTTRKARRDREKERREKEESSSDKE